MAPLRRWRFLDVDDSAGLVNGRLRIDDTQPRRIHLRLGEGEKVLIHGAAGGVARAVRRSRIRRVPLP